MFSSALKLACVAGAAAHVVTVRPRPSLPVLRAKATPSMNVANEVSTMLSNAGIEQVGPVLYSQLGVSGAMLAGGFGLNAFVDVPEPEEFETPEGETDIYRDSPLRYLGYANEVGEAFRPLVPVEIVYVSYVLAITYILADTVDKGKQGAADGGGAIRGTLGALDTFCWQMLASVLFPSCAAAAVDPCRMLARRLPPKARPHPHPFSLLHSLCSHVLSRRPRTGSSSTASCACWPPWAPTARCPTCSRRAGSRRWWAWP